MCLELGIISFLLILRYVGSKCVGSLNENGSTKELRGVTHPITVQLPACLSHSHIKSKWESLVCTAWLVDHSTVTTLYVLSSRTFL